MLVDTPQIVWHGGEAGKNAPVLSVDAHPLPVIQNRKDDSRNGFRSQRFILATAGTDAEVRLWLVRQPTGEDERRWDKVEVSGQLQSFIASLEGHQRGVNVVRFSPDGLSLASASDGGTVVVWSVGDATTWSNLKSGRETHKLVLRGANEDIYDLAWSPDSKYIACGSIDRRAHVWEVVTKRSIATLEDHTNYVQGTAWDPLYKYVATQSSDRSCRVYQLLHEGDQIDQDRGNGRLGLGRLKMRCSNTIKSCLVALEGRVTESSAGSQVSRVPELGGRHDAVAGESLGNDLERRGASATPTQAEKEEISSKGESPPPPPGVGAEDAAECHVIRGANGRGVDQDTPPKGGGFNAGGTKGKSKSAQRKNLFVDETVTSFFRRLAWSPDGAFLITPTAQGWDATTGKTQFCTYLFKRDQFDKPAVCLPGLSKPSIAVRCNPRLFALKASTEKGTDDMHEGSRSMCDLPYRIVFAVVSLDAVVVYDTEHSHPLTMATGLHYSGLTDACWSPDGHSLFVSSSDGYLSKIHFAEGELGVLIPESDVPSQTKRLYPTIYGEDEPPEEISISASDSSAGGRTRGNVPTRNIGEDDKNRTAKHVASNHLLAHVLTVRPKKKIAPTLVKSWPDADDKGGALSAAQQPQTPETEEPEAAVGMAIAGSSSPSCGGKISNNVNIHSQKKKRRIAPTLLGSDSTAAFMLHTDEGLVANGGNFPQVSSFRDDIAQGNTHQDRAPKKRLAPTLVSGL